MSRVKLVFNKSIKVILKKWGPYFGAYSLGLVLLVSGNSLAQAQENTKDPDEDAEFVNFGYISVSPRYTLAPRAKSIIFIIRNNATRSIQSIFGWVYEFQQEEEGGASQFRLVNNPNKGGVLIKGGAHEPAAEKQWRFPLVAANPPIDPSKQFTILVDPRGIRFAAFEKN